MRTLTSLAIVAMALLTAAPPPARTARPSRIRVPFWTPSPEAMDQRDLSARINGAPARVLGVQGPATDLVVLVVLDLAGDLAYVEPARNSLIEEIEKLPRNAWVGLLRAQDGLRVLADPTPDRARIATTVRDLSISGRAGLLDAVETSGQLASTILSRAHVRVAVLHITDSSIRNYREDYTNPVVNSSDSRDMSRRFPEGLIKEKIQQIARRVSALEAPMFVVHLNYQNDRLDEAYQTGLLELATTSGGIAEFCRSVADIPVSIGRVMAAIAEHQSAEIELRPGKFKQAEISLEGGGRALRHRNRLAVGEK